MNEPENPEIVFYFSATSDEAKQAIDEFIENTNGIKLLSMTDMGYFYHKIMSRQGSA